MRIKTSWIALLLLFLLVGCATTTSVWHKTQQLNTIEAYEKFLQKYPRSKFTAEANRQIERLTWDASQRRNTIEAYQDFLRKYPQSEFTTEAGNRVQRLQAEDELKRMLETAKIPLQIQELLETHPDMAESILPKLEQAILQEIRSKGIGDRFFIKEIVPEQGDWLSKVTIGSHLEGIPYYVELPNSYLEDSRFIEISSETSVSIQQGGWTMSPQFSNKILPVLYRIPVPLRVGSLTVTTKNEFIKLLLEYPSDGFPIVSDSPYLSFKSGSIHRFLGEIEFKLNRVYTFIGEGDKLNRLTFVMVDRIGYVYLRGKGRVMLDGKEVKLGD